MDKKLYLLKEMTEFNFINEVDEKGAPKLSKYGNMMVKGILQRADATNQNGRVYPRRILEKEIENYRKLIAERRATGELDHADSSVVNLQKVSHVITDVWWDGDTVMGRVEILESMDQGRQLKALFDNGIKVGISSRAIGSVTNIGGINYVEDDLQLICWDFVSEPSTHNAFMMQEARLLTKNEIEKLEQSNTKISKLDKIVNEVLSYKK